jgi:O-antigen/teichoic acid export membrane protein
VGITIFSGGAAVAIQIVAAVVLARLLAPTDFGVVTMVTTFSYLLMNFGLNGLTEAVIQCEEISHDLASTLFWINVGCGALLTIGFAAAGSLLAWFYKDPHVEGVAAAVSLTILLTSTSVMHLALLKRAMRFSEVSFNDICGRVVSVVVSILLGWAGWGYWALAAGAIALSASTCIGAWILCHWTPGLPRRVPGTGSMIRFAIHTYGRFSTGYFTLNLDNFLVGWRFGPTPLGFYKKAFDLFVLPSNQLSTGLAIVAVTTLSRLQRDKVQYKRYLLGALGVMAFVGMGISADLTLVGKDLILVLLGPKWGESGRLFTIFAPGIGFMLLYFTHIWIHLSLGKAERWFRWGIVDLVVTTAFLFVGLHWHAEGIAGAWVASYLVITLPALWYAGKPIQLGISPVIAVIWKYIVCSLIAGVASFLVLQAFPSFLAAPGPFWAAIRLAAVSLMFLVLYLVTVIALHRSFAPLFRVAGLLREMTSQRKLPEPVLRSESQIPDCNISSKEILATAEISREYFNETGRRA